jgi:spore coat protein U domain-containing protein, fimbrial subunit CupE1/2/3/6
MPRLCKIILQAWLGLALAGTATAGCSINATTLNFGEYDVFDVSPADITGTLSVSCDADTPFQVALGPGQGNFAARQLQNGPNVLIYNLYTDPTRLSIWGDGSPGTSILSSSGTGASYTVYGRIPARQNVRAGSYADTITVTLTF